RRHRRAHAACRRLDNRPIVREVGRMSARMLVEPGELRRAAHTALAHAERVARDTAMLESATRERPIGHGRHAMLVENAVRPLLQTVVDDGGKTGVGILRSLGEGLLQTASNVETTDDAVRRDLDIPVPGDPIGGEPDRATPRGWHSL